MYNPFSLLNALDQQMIGSYWLLSGASKVFLTYLRRSRVSLDDLENIWTSDVELASMYSSENPVSLLYQTGYLTIKGYKNRYYRLGIPNGEVRAALVEELIPNYIGVNNLQFNRQMTQIADDLKSGEAHNLMVKLKALIAGIPYQQFETANLEKTYHLSIYLIFLMLGVDVRSEISMSGGRIDMVAETAKYIYVFEFKLDGTPEEAMRQIDQRGYSLPYQIGSREVIKIGVSFSSATRTIASWLISRQ